MYDLIVIGGGPAGAAAAIASAQQGGRVLLFERGSFPRHKVCGEFVSAESLGLLADLLDPQEAGLLRDAIRIPEARIFVDGRTLHTEITPAAASIARFDLDVGLWNSAVRSGVEARQQVTVQQISGTGPFQVTTSAGDYQSRAVVNGSGRWSNLNRESAGNGKAGAKWIGLKGHFAEAAPPPSVDLYFFDGGYCGVQPVNLEAEKAGSVNACAMVRADVAVTLPEVLSLHPILRERASQWKPLSHPVSVGPLLFRPPQPEADGILRVGDAAAFVDPFVGDGISLALRSGVLAAKYLLPFLSGSATIEEAALLYREEYNQRLAPVFRMSSRIRQMLSLPSAVRKPILSALQYAPGITRFLVSQTR